MLVQQLIVGLRDEKARKSRLSEKKDLSWEKACDIASHQERVRQNLQQLNQSNDGVIASLISVMAVSLVNTAVSSPKPISSLKTTIILLPLWSASYPMVRLQTPEDAGDGETMLRMFSANALLQSLYTTTLPIDRHPVKCEIDTGSTVTLISEASLQKSASLLSASSIFHFRLRFFKALTVPSAVSPKIEELDRLQKADIIEPVQYSEWATPIVPLLKSDGSVRTCGDYKLTIKSATKLNPCPLPFIEDLYTSLFGGHQFTTLDLKHAYYQVVLDTESRDANTINTHRVFFRYKRLPFGAEIVAGGVEEKLMDGRCGYTRLDVHPSMIAEVAVRPVSSEDPRVFVTVGVNQHDREHETEEGGREDAAPLHSVGHCDSIFRDSHRHAIVDLMHYLGESLEAAEFLNK
ncbi:hypothetical protein SprV_0301207000 [Sparganum proliferum]